MSRPFPPERIAADRARELTYIGHACAKGHAPERYTNTGRCVQCSKANDNRRVRDRRTAVQVMREPPTFVMLADWRVVTP